ncbi:MAG: long-chain fatty acid--CoA ligase [Gammaproteobacteria bacterium]|nr:long-chain fatty acid--CoA ligase [Gammaproteobacteria bacterium]
MNTLLHTLQQHAHAHPDSRALVGTHATISYRQLMDAIESCRCWLIKQGCRTIALLMDNDPAWAVIDLAAQTAHCTLVPLPAFFSDKQLIHAMQDAGVDTIITDQPQRIVQLGSTHRWIGNQPESLTVTGNEYRYFSLEANGQAADSTQQSMKITYTSGTTGEPKGVCLDDAALYRVAHAVMARTAIEANHRHVSLLPLATLLENSAGLYSTLLAGATAVLLPMQLTGMQGASGLNIKKMANVLRTECANSAILLPQMLQELVQALESKAIAALPELKFLAVGGAPLSSQLLHRARQCGLPLYEGYGLSECASVVAVNCANDHRPGSVGKPLEHVELRFASDGEILIKGSLFQGYLGAAAHDHSHYFASGDIGYLDDDGYLYITGRKKNMFITSYGRNIAPEWVEKELIIHPAIAQAAVFGEGQTECCAVIVAADKLSTDMVTIATQQVQQAITQTNLTLPDYAKIAQWIFADRPFSMSNEQLTATGRPRRNAIWSRYGERLNARYQQLSTASN